MKRNIFIFGLFYIVIGPHWARIWDTESEKYGGYYMDSALEFHCGPILWPENWPEPIFLSKWLYWCCDYFFIVDINLRMLKGVWLPWIGQQPAWSKSRKTRLLFPGRLSCIRECWLESISIWWSWCVSDCICWSRRVKVCNCWVTDRTC